MERHPFSIPNSADPHCTISKLPSVIASASNSKFAVRTVPLLNLDDGDDYQLHILGRAPIDLVLVLDVSESMMGAKLALLKRVVELALARCVGGLLSVVAKQVQLGMRTILSFGVRIGSIALGRYSNDTSKQGRQGRIDVKDLYADEEKEFLVYLSIPSATAEEKVYKKTSLMVVTCSFKDTVSNHTGHVKGVRVVIRYCGGKRKVEMEGVKGAQDVLGLRRVTLRSLASGQVGDGPCNQLKAELLEVKERMGSLDLYESKGKLYVLAGLNSHSQQRATTRGVNIKPVDDDPVGYETPSMASLVSKSPKAFAAIILDY
ncbi:hypothetical protein RJ640_026086 [Escallonia rubra]|uniref:VWA-Hint protein Vwaint domain-containing protein n=1 Tax=Escallonia rubra TaxID=112253 RepID=A0AA88RMX8_9ASTE|nr:hypothetical protein RJ640_026086 [Escallonia rubra]